MIENIYTRHCLATYKDGIFSPVGTQIGNTNDIIYDIEWHKNELYIGGSLNDAGDDFDADNFAKLVDETWEGTGIFSEEVSALHSTSVNLYIGGAFSNLNGIDEIDGVTRYGCPFQTTTKTNEVFSSILPPTIYPNPTNGRFQFNHTIDKVVLYSLFGNKLSSDFNTREVSLSNLVSGMYLVECTVNGVRTIQKVVKE